MYDVIVEFPKMKVGVATRDGQVRVWDTKTGEKLDKDRFRRDLGNVEEAYQEVARRLGIFPEGGPRDMKGPTTMQ